MNRYAWVRRKDGRRQSWCKPPALIGSRARRAGLCPRTPVHHRPPAWHARPAHWRASPDRGQPRGFSKAERSNTGARSGVFPAHRRRRSNRDPAATRRRQAQSPETPQRTRPCPVRPKFHSPLKTKTFLIRRDEPILMSLTAFRGPRALGRRSTPRRFVRRACPVYRLGLAPRSPSGSGTAPA